MVDGGQETATKRFWLFFDSTSGLFWDKITPTIRCNNIRYNLIRHHKVQHLYTASSLTITELISRIYSRFKHNNNLQYRSHLFSTYTVLPTTLPLLNPTQVKYTLQIIFGVSILWHAFVRINTNKHSA